MQKTPQKYNYRWVVYWQLWHLLVGSTFRVGSTSSEWITHFNATIRKINNHVDICVFELIKEPNDELQKKISCLKNEVFRDKQVGPIFKQWFRPGLLINQV